MRRGYIAAALAALCAPGAEAGPLDGKSYIIELSSSQYASGYGDYLVPPLARAMAASGLRARKGPGADVVVNVVVNSDIGAWRDFRGQREWIYEVAVTVGLSPESYVIPFDGTPVFGVTALLETPNADREDELDCLITLAARTALANYRAEGHLRTDGSSCLRQ